MATDNPSTGESAQPRVSIDKSAYDVKFSVDTTPTSRVTVPEPAPVPARPVPVPAALPDVNAGGNPAADQQR